MENYKIEFVPEKIDIWNPPSKEREIIITMENKYYTPDAEDFFIGYECEINTMTYKGFAFLDFTNNREGDFIPPPEGNEYPVYEKRVIQQRETFDDFFFMEDALRCLKENRLRTTYLTKEQIEAEGWKHEGKNIVPVKDETFEFGEKFKKRNFTVVFNINRIYGEYSRKFEDGHTLTYLEIKSGSLNHILYCGHCNSINEFRKICKWLGIS